MKSYTHKDGKLRLYDATATPFYIEIPFVGADFEGPEGRPRPEEVPVMNRNLLDTNTHYVQGPDTPIMEGQELSFSFKLANTEPVYQKLRDAMNLDMAAAPWTVGVNTWVSTKGKTQLLSGGETPTLVTTPTFSDSRKRCVHVEALFVDVDGANDIGRRWAEVYFPPDRQRFREGDLEVTISVAGLCYGSITEITAFTAGTSS